ncbi:MAG TPA: hypothetical protein VHF67_14330 [Gaiellaceae bacterium]|nr:hypothetical protein [Gaiellaceae bacterium]
MTAPGRSETRLVNERRERARLERRRARRQRALAAGLATAFAAIAFFAGLALGRALEERPRPGGTQSLVRTLQPGTLPPVTRTVTVTTQTP